MEGLEILLGVVLALLAVLGFKKFNPKDLPPELNDDRVEELEDKLDELEQREEELKGGVEEKTPEEVEDYWRGK